MICYAVIDNEYTVKQKEKNPWAKCLKTRLVFFLTVFTIVFAEGPKERDREGGREREGSAVGEEEERLTLSFLLLHQGF